MINIIDFQRYHMELALIMYLCDNDYHARFITPKIIRNQGFVPDSDSHL